MIRTAILAGILLVMLSIAYNRPGTLPGTLPDEARVVAAVTAPAPEPEEPAQPAPRASAPARIESAPMRDPVSQPVSQPPPPPVVVEDRTEASPPASPVVQISVSAPLPSVGKPLSLLPPAVTPPEQMPSAQQEQPAPALAPLPEVHVAPRPVMLPPDPASRQSTPTSIATAASADAPGATPPPRFMSPQERTRELYRLAREMEETFIDKMAR